MEKLSQLLIMVVASWFVPLIVFVCVEQIFKVTIPMSFTTIGCFWVLICMHEIVIKRWIFEEVK